MLPVLLLAAASAFHPADDIRVENGVRVHRMEPAPTPAAPSDEPLQLRLDPGYRGTELYTPSRIEMRFRQPVLGLIYQPVFISGGGAFTLP
jgi:hypothetical protein